ncbi:hypothetical protein EDB85DRAFT_1895803 [Lactarius pseudohatsudake]|nr:hypothetical protein EDB85DRAFT_1895803 [Lactarius pseudohatsudake]
MPAIPIGGQTVESYLVAMLNYTEYIASLTPISGLKNVLGSLLALVHAGYNDGQDGPISIEATTATCRQKLSRGRFERFAAGMESVRTQLIREVTISYSCISDAIERIMKGETVQLLDNVGKVKCGIEPIVSKKTKNPNLSTHTQHTECLEGTRTAVLDEVFAWLKDPSSARIFWLSGIAGSGKSAISQSVSLHAALPDGHLVISDFATHPPSSKHSPFSLLDIGYKERISGVIDEYPDIFENDLRVQYEKLIIEPLGAIRRSHNCILITLDGLDECEPHGATAVLKVLLAEDVDHPKGLKILTASRPEAHLQRDIWKRSLGDVETESDIRHYLRTSFNQTPNPLVNPFTVSEGTISELAKRAGNSFIYAATTVRFIFDDHCQDPQKRVDFLLSHRMDAEQRPYAHLDALFLDILQQALPLGARIDEKRKQHKVFPGISVLEGKQVVKYAHLRIARVRAMSEVLSTRVGMGKFRSEPEPTRTGPTVPFGVRQNPEI